jgi:acetyl-CoA C-acetyltransferase
MSKKTEVIITGIGQIPVGEHWETSLRSMAGKAMRNAIADSGMMKPQALYVGNMLASTLSRQAHLGVLLADFSGFIGIEAETLEAGGASGGSALRQGYLAVASGMVDVALVVGVEKFTDTIGPEGESALATLTDADYESVHGLTVTAQAALLECRYLHENQVPADGLAGFPLTAHENAVGNKNAMYRKPISLETYQKAELVCSPLNLYDISPTADGAAAIILTRRELLSSRYQNPVIHVAASTVGSDTLSLAERGDPLWFSSAQASIEAAYEKAEIKPEHVDLFEYHDVYSIYAALSLEAAGFARRGHGWQLAADGAIALTGQIPCATLGGSKARGNPGGATGIYQAVEATLQLRGQAGANQIGDAKTALIQSLGGPASVAVTHILVREDE